MILMKMKELCGKINNVPTLLAVIDVNGMERTVCRWASYDSGSGEGTLLYYFGPYDIRRTVMTEEAEDERDLHKEYVARIAFRDNIRIGDDVTPYFTEYDFTEPGDLPDWAAKVWVKRQKVNLRGDLSWGRCLNISRRKSTPNE